MAKRIGETVSIQMDGFDADGNQMSMLRVEWYGMENAFSNKMQSDVVSGLNEIVKSWDALKNSQGSTKKE